MTIKKIYCLLSLGLDKFEGEPNAVVVGLAPEHFHYDELNTAFRYFVGLFTGLQVEIFVC